MVGIIIFSFSIWFLANSELGIGLYLFFGVVFAVTFYIAVVQVIRLRPGIIEATARGNLFETERSYDGTKTFSSKIPSIGGVVGVALYAFLSRFENSVVAGALLGIIMTIGPALILGVSLAYIYLEHKIQRQILVQRYEVLKVKE